MQEIHQWLLKSVERIEPLEIPLEQKLISASTLLTCMFQLRLEFNPTTRRQLLQLLKVQTYSERDVRCEEFDVLCKASEETRYSE